MIKNHKYAAGTSTYKYCRDGKLFKQTKTKINGAVTSKLLYYIMNPANGGYIQKLTQHQIINAYNIFFIRP